MRQILISWVLLASLPLFGQEHDTLYLDTVEIQSLRIDILDGLLPIQHIKIKDKTQSMVSLLSAEAIHFRQYGYGQLSSVVFRGSNPSQTQLLWQGIPANYPSLGQIDFGQIPLWFIDEVKISSGNNVLTGSHALGGVISLNESPAFIANQKAANLMLTSGSYGLFSLGSYLKLNNTNFSSTSWAWIENRENDFTYTHENDNMRQTNAGQNTWAVQQRLTVKHKYGFSLAEIHHHQQDRQIQPNKNSPQGTDSLLTKNTRAILRYHFYQSKFSLNSSLSYFRFTQQFNQDSPITTGQWSFQNLAELSPSPSTRIKFGHLTLFNQAVTDYYVDKINEWQHQLFGSIEKSFFKEKWISQFYFRIFIDPFGIKIAPAFSQKLKLNSQSVHSLTVSHSYSKNYRMPTLNDRYWLPGGNRLLNPEEGHTQEVNLSFDKRTAKLNFTWQGTGYITQSENWILWLPTSSGFWSPKNINDVRVMGIEMRNKFEYYINQHNFQLVQNSKLSQSKVQRGIGAGYLLPYAPLVLHSFSGKWMFKQVSTQLVISKTGEQSTQLGDNSASKLPGWWMVDQQTSIQFAQKHTKSHFIVKINNLLDKRYESIENYAMPGRNYEFSILLQFKNNENNEKNN